METNKKILFLNTFAIILVCVGHSFTAVESHYGHKWIYSFHMPLFMFVSGYLLKYSAMHKQQGISNICLWGCHGYIKRRAVRLLVPYFIISTISFIPKALLSVHALRPVDFSIYSYLHMLLYPWDNVIKFFWFLPTLFIISILTVLLYKAGKRFNIKLPVTMSLFLLILLYEYNPFKHIEILNLGGVASYLFFFVAGCIFSQYESILNRCLRLSKTHITWGILIIYSTIIYLTTWHTPFIGIIYAITGILFCLSLSSLYVRNDLKFMNHLYNSSYAIYLLSWYPLVIIQSFLIKKYELPWVLWSIISTLVQIYIPFCIYKFIIYIKNNQRYGKIIATLLGQ